MVGRPTLTLDFQRERQTDRQRQRETETERQRQKETETDRQRDRVRDRKTNRQTDRDPRLHLKGILPFVKVKCSNRKFRE